MVPPSKSAAVRRVANSDLGLSVELVSPVVVLLWLLLLNKAVSAREQYLVIELWCAVSWGCAAKIPITIGGGGGNCRSPLRF